MQGIFPIQTFLMAVITFCLISIVVCGVAGARARVAWGSLKIAGPILFIVIIISLIILAWTIGMGAP